jgi:hypothetical protein
LFEELAETAKFFIMGDIHRKKIKIHSIPYRIKKFDSFVDKIRRKNVNEPFKEIMDIVGSPCFGFIFIDMFTIKYYKHFI